MQSIAGNRIVFPRRLITWMAAAALICLAGPVAAQSERDPQAVQAYERGQAAHAAAVVVEQAEVCSGQGGRRDGVSTARFWERRGQKWREGPGEDSERKQL